MMKKERTKSQIGKANRASGARFERKVRADLESKGWIVSRWGNNVEFYADIKKRLVDYEGGKEKIGEIKGKLIPAKSTRFRSNTHGFPDFVMWLPKNIKV